MTLEFPPDFEFSDWKLQAPVAQVTPEKLPTPGVSVFGSVMTTEDMDIHVKAYEHELSKWIHDMYEKDRTTVSMSSNQLASLHDGFAPLGRCDWDDEEEDVLNLFAWKIRDFKRIDPVYFEELVYWGVDDWGNEETYKICYDEMEAYETLNGDCTALRLTQIVRLPVDGG